MQSISDHFEYRSKRREKMKNKTNKQTPPEIQSITKTIYNSKKVDILKIDT